MEIMLSRNEVVDVLESSVSAYLALKIGYPAFFIESTYADFFSNFVRWCKLPEDSNVFSFIKREFEKCLSEAINEICKKLSENSADGTRIWEMINDGRIILRKYQHEYNKQILGKCPKGLTSELCQEYNHWLVAASLWEGLKNCFQPSFSVIIPDDSDDPIEKLLAPEIRPLWGMFYAFSNLGRPLYICTNTGDSFYAKPYASFKKYRVKLTGSGKLYRK